MKRGAGIEAVGGDGGGKHVLMYLKTKEHDIIPAGDHYSGAGRSSNDGRTYCRFYLQQRPPLLLSERPKLKLVIEGARHVPNSHKLPRRQIVVRPLLDANFFTSGGEIKGQILKKAGELWGNLTLVVITFE